MGRTLLLALAALAALAAPSGRAGVFGDDPDELRPIARLGQLRVIGLQVRVNGLGWVGPGHRRPSDRVPRTLGLGDALPVPDGDWSDLVLDLDGPVVVTVERPDGRVLTFEADLDTLTVPLDDPGARAVALSLDLPALLPEGAAARARIVADGIVAVADD